MARSPSAQRATPATSGVVGRVLLGLLAERPRHGYELKAAFEQLLAGTWRLNVSQVYRGLGRLEEDGLVVSESVAQDSLPDRRVYHLTPIGHDAVRRWLAAPSADPERLRDELFVKVLVAARAGQRFVRSVLMAERKHRLDSIATLGRRRMAPSIDQETALVLDGLILKLEADLKWLDECEARWGQA